MELPIDAQGSAGNYFGWVMKRNMIIQPRAQGFLGKSKTQWSSDARL
jgi:hypothetical protein